MCSMDKNWDVYRKWGMNRKYCKSELGSGGGNAPIQGFQLNKMEVSECAASVGAGV